LTRSSEQAADLNSGLSLLTLMAADSVKSKPLFFLVMSGKKKKKLPKVKRIKPKVKASNVAVDMKGPFKEKWSSTKTVYKRPR
jgi:hypothetical protein